MKRAAILAMACMAALSCSRDRNDMAADVLPAGAPDTFRAEYADTYGSATKVTYDAPTGLMAWEDADRISVNGATYERNDAGGYFRYHSGGYTTGADGVVGIYPVSLYTGGTGAGTAKYSLPYDYTWNTSTGKIDYIPLAGKADDDNVIRFKNLASLFKVTVSNSSGEDCWLKSVTLSTDSDRSMSGDFSLSFTGGVPALTFDATGSVYPSVAITLDNVVKIATGDTYTVYLPVPAQTYTKFNVKVMAYVAEGEQYADMRFYNSSATTEAGKTETVPSLTCDRSTVYDLNVNVESLSNGIVGDGTAVSPYEIGGIDDLKYVQLMVKNATDVSFKHFTTSYYKLTDDITLTEAWTSCLSGSFIGSSNGFAGVFDGDGHTIDVSSATNTAPIFFDMEDATIKHLKLKGDYNFTPGYCTVSPFFVAAKGDVTMVAVMYEGSLDGSWTPQGWGSLSIFGHYAGETNVVGCYAKATIDTTNASWCKYAYQVFGMTSSSYVGRKGPHSSGVIADLIRKDATEPGSPVAVSVHSVDDAIVPYASAPDTEAEMNELHSAICEWNNRLKLKLDAGTITQQEYERKVSLYTYSIEDSKLTLVDKNQ